MSSKHRRARDDLLILKDLGLLKSYSKQQKERIAYMDRSDWFTLWKNFHAWYNGVVKDSGHAPTWRRQQNKIHKLVTKAMHYRRAQPPVMGKRPVGRPRKHPQPVPQPPGPGRQMDNTPAEPLPTLPAREQQ